MDLEKAQLKRMLGLTADLLAAEWAKVPDQCACRIGVPTLCEACVERQGVLSSIRAAARMTDEEEEAYFRQRGTRRVSGKAWDAAARDSLDMLRGLNGPPGDGQQLP